MVANFKSHKTQSEVEAWLKAVPPTPNIFVAPSFPHLPLAVSRWPLAVCAQDVSPFPPGSYTGAVSARELKDLGATLCLVGHSERREYFHETSVDVARKVKELVAVGITPIVCLRQEDLVSEHAALDDQLVAACRFCYEPSADIGGTTTAPLEDIKATTSRIAAIFNTTEVMYGGSVNADNLESLFPLGLGGVLVATACLDSVSFKQILAKLSHAKL